MADSSTVTALWRAVLASGTYLDSNPRMGGALAVGMYLWPGLQFLSKS